MYSLFLSLRPISPFAMLFNFLRGYSKAYLWFCWFFFFLGSRWQPYTDHGNPLFNDIILDIHDWVRSTCPSYRLHLPPSPAPSSPSAAWPQKYPTTILRTNIEQKKDPNKSFVMVKVLENQIIDLDLLPGKEQQELKKRIQEHIAKTGYVL